MMTVIFDENGLATQAGDIRCFYYDAASGEYKGWSDEHIYVGVSMPGYSTAVDPGDVQVGFVAVFNGAAWERHPDHRGENVYSTADGCATVVGYIGEIKEGFTVVAPPTSHDEWDGVEWVTDTDARHAADVAAAEQQRQSLIDAAIQSINVIQLKLQAGRKLTATETAKLGATLDYIDAVTTMNTNTAPDIDWPPIPA